MIDPDTASATTSATRSPRERFHGIIPPMVTPLTEQLTLDVGGLERLVAFLLDGGVHGLFILGSCGEGPVLSPAVQRELIERTTALVAGRVPVLVGITDACVSESLVLADHAADVGADAVVAAAPFYFQMSQHQLVRWAERLAARSPLPMLFYNMPAMVKISIEPESMRQLTQCPNIVGFKDSSFDLQLFQQLAAVGRAERPEWAMLVGPEELLPGAYACGGNGAIPGGANIAPQLFSAMYDALVENKHDLVDTLHNQANLLQPLYALGGQPGSFIVGIKSAVAALGICNEQWAGEFDELTPDQRQQLQAILTSLGLGNA
jgi:dihydrodipicolinate synthase/N-acetylneuraminate lyase